MTRKEFWDSKLRMALHDPPHKPFVLKSGTGGHARAAKALYEAIAQRPLLWYSRIADLAASGADRPVLNRPRGSTGETLKGYFVRQPVLTHPLNGNCALRLATHGDALPKPQDLLDRQMEVLQQASESIDDAADEAAPPLEADESVFWWVWRAWRDELSLPGGKSESPLWDLLPGESRCPDHSIWEHLRVASALAFLGVRDEARHPWLVCVSVDPVQSFIRESRSSRDLWMSSFIISELAFAAMMPFIERYGPDSILYPDLRGNARMDVWLEANRKYALPSSVQETGTQAALIPDTFVALIPQGESAASLNGESYLRSVSAMAEESRERMRLRWLEFGSLVEDWLKAKTGVNTWQPIWDRQIDQSPQLSWTALKWDRHNNEKVRDVKNLDRRESLPAQAPRREPIPESDAVAIENRQRRISPWLTPDIAAHYEVARAVFANVNPGFIHTERGFDYPLAHHVLRSRHRARAGQRVWSKAAPEPGEKCTMCGKRQALTDTVDGNRDIDDVRSDSRRFWAGNEELDPEGKGAERLCAVCAVKRFLVPASSRDPKKGIGSILFGADWVDERDGHDLRVPFPSTSALALQDYAAWAADRPEGAALLRALRSARIEETSFPRALVTLALPRQSDLLKYDPQYLMPHTLNAEIDTLQERGKESRKNALIAIREAATKLRQAWNRRKTENNDSNDTRVAVVVLDMDQLGRLILGDPDRIGATWRDVLHPNVADQLSKSASDESGSTAWMRESGWPLLLDRPRHMGPSLHAFVTRALAVFANVIVPWVVEREYRGRVIYAGGDDILAMAPAADALPMAARLQQLLSAAWVIDTAPVSSWEWRKKNWASSVGGKDAAELRRAARERFVIPWPIEGERQIHWPVPASSVEPHSDPNAFGKGDSGPRTGVDIRGRVYPMLGRKQSLSAGIAYAHYKNDHRLLMAQARTLLKLAKGNKDNESGRVALSHFSRNGEKTSFVMPWSQDAGRPPDAQRSLLNIIDNYKNGNLPRRLPYKLRERVDLALAAGDLSWKLLCGLLATALDSPVDDQLKSDIVAVWKHGFHGDPEHAADGLLLCRALSSGGDS